MWRLHCFKIENWRGKLLWLRYPRDSYEKHCERYYNLKSVKRIFENLQKDLTSN